MVRNHGPSCKASQIAYRSIRRLQKRECCMLGWDWSGEKIEKNGRPLAVEISVALSVVLSSCAHPRVDVSRASEEHACASSSDGS